jgi:hypothetical protein
MALQRCGNRALHHVRLSQSRDDVTIAAADRTTIADNANGDKLTGNPSPGAVVNVRAEEQQDRRRSIASPRRQRANRPPLVPAAVWP